MEPIYFLIIFSSWKAIASAAKNVTLGLVQTSIPIGREREKDNRDYIQNSMELAFNYAVKILITSPNPVDLLVFPESSIPFHPPIRILPSRSICIPAHSMGL